MPQKILTPINKQLVFFCMLLLALTQQNALAALMCSANPTSDGNASISGQPAALKFYVTTGNASAGSSTIPVSSTAGLAADDLVLVIQMQAAEINSSNTDSYGDGVSGGVAAGWLNNANFIAGYYEYVGVQSVSGTSITLKTPLIHSYIRSDYVSTIGQRRYQVIRVPQYNNLTLTANITAPAWNGETGGVLALDVVNTMNFAGKTVDMQEKGFRGGGSRQLFGGAGGTSADIRTLASNSFNAGKGEGFAGTPRYLRPTTGNTAIDTLLEGYQNGSFANGAPANAGGGGTDGNPASNDQNSGGGGGGNGGAGGRGGNSWSSNLAVGGYGGAAFSSAANRIVLGGGGGGGTSNNAATTSPHGGTGGGIVLIRAGTIQGSGTITTNGGNGNSPNATNDGAGGGGAGGSVILISNTQIGGITINAIGGGGGNADPGGASHGPGGGGGGGAVLTNSAITPITNVSQGTSGYAVTPGSYFGASPSGGSSGNGVPNTNPAGIDGNSAGYDCTPKADLAITKTRSSGPMQASGTAQFKIAVNNIGPDATTSPMVVTDVLDSRFTYTSFTGTGWNCVEAPTQTLNCTHNGPLAASASLPNLFINVNISTSSSSQSVSNTATVAFNNTGATTNTDSNLANNTSTLNDTIYGLTINGNKLIYTYPTSETGGTVQRVVPTTNATQTIGEDSIMQLDLSPSLASNLTFSGNIIVNLCLRREGGKKKRKVEVSLRRADTDAQIPGTSVPTVSFNNTSWGWFTFTITHTGPSTITSAQNLRLQIFNNSSGPLGITSNGGGGNCDTSIVPSISHAAIQASTVINVSDVSIYNAASPLGNVVTTVPENALVYIRSTITDPFGFADINNDTTVDVLNATNSVVSGPHNDTNILSSTGSTKIFEYEVTMPNDWTAGPYTLRVRGNEGTEGTVWHYGATTISLTKPPLLSVTKVSSQASGSPGQDINYTVVVSNSNILSTGNATAVVAEDTLPDYTQFKIGSIVLTEGTTPYLPSTLLSPAPTITYYNSANTVITPTSGQGGAPAGYDGRVKRFKMVFDITKSMPQGSAFKLDYTIKIK